MMTLIRTLLLLAATATAPLVHAQSAAPPSRGQLLYETHCIECHNTQVHWRARSQARDWDSLKSQVQQWQEAGRLGWNDGDIDAVARFLNRTIYHFPGQPERLSSGPSSARQGPQ